MKKQEISSKMGDFYYDKAIARRYSQSTQHYHPNLEIYYMKEGKCRYFIDDRSYDVMSGDVIFIPKGVIHRTNYIGQTHSRLLLNFTDEYVPDGLLEHIAGFDYLYRGREITRVVDEIFAKIEREYIKPDQFSKGAIKCYTGELLFLLLRHHGKKEDIESSNALVENTVRYVQQNYMQDIKLSAVAKRASVSAEHLSRIFKKNTGFGFNEYVTLLRLKKAEQMLKNEPGLSVSEVAYECGFNDGNYFSYKFKQMYGVSPTKVRGNGSGA